MISAPKYDFVVVGAGINGMVCALLAARQGFRVLLVEGYSRLGGGIRTEELTLPGYLHDICSAIHPFGKSSPVLRDLDLEEEGLEWIEPEVPLAHPLIGESAVLLHRDVAATVESIGRRGAAYGPMMRNLIAQWPILEEHLLGPALRPPKWSQLIPLARFGPLAGLPASAMRPLLGKRGAALWAGLAGHSLLPMESWGSSAVACVLGLLAHRVGWPMPRGGAENLSRALESKLREAGVEIRLNERVTDLRQLPTHRALVLDLTTRPILELLGPLLDPNVRRSLERYRLGPGIFKVDYALSEPVPWLDPSVRSAPTVHIGGTLQDIARSERAVWNGAPDREPFLLAVQPTLHDPSRAPDGKHVLWVYMHTPNGWNGDGLAILEGQLERFAPGFREVIEKRAVRTSASYEAYNPNYVGGDILGGANTLYQVVARPFPARDPYHLGGNVFCCSASVPPGGGVHGMGGYHAYRSVARRVFDCNKAVTLDASH